MDEHPGISRNEITWCFDKSAWDEKCGKYEHETRDWLPFDRANSRQIEDAYQSGNKFVILKHGRFRIDFAKRDLKPVYWDAPGRRVCRARWFILKSGKRIEPYPEYVSKLVEDFAKQRLFNEPLYLPDAEHHVICHLPPSKIDITAMNTSQLIIHEKRMEAIPTKNHRLSGMYCHSNDHKSTYKVSRYHPMLVQEVRNEQAKTAEMTASQDVPSSNGGDGETKKSQQSYTTRPVVHLVLCVHGIGEAEWTKKDEWKFPETVNRLRGNAGKLIDKQFPDSDRVEFLPVLWHSVLHETDFKRQLMKTSIRNMESLRAFANGVVMDVLFYLTPHIHQLIVTYVAKEMNRIVELWCENNPSFTPSNISIMAHSLGSSIVYDILTHQPNSHIMRKHAEQSEPTLAPALTCPALTFKLQHLFALGSPIGMFEAMYANQRNQLSSYDFEFYNHCCLWNIYHPYDPVAYRIEPLIHADFEEVDAVLLDTESSSRKKSIDRTEEDEDTIGRRMSTFFGMNSSTSSNTPSSSAAYVNPGEAEMEKKAHEDKLSNLVHQLGAFNGHRIDHQLQETTLQRAQPLLAAIGAHTLYWDSNDALLFCLEKVVGNVVVLEPSSFVSDTEIVTSKPKNPFMDIEDEDDENETTKGDVQVTLPSSITTSAVMNDAADDVVVTATAAADGDDGDDGDNESVAQQVHGGGEEEETDSVVSLVPGEVITGEVAMEGNEGDESMLAQQVEEEATQDGLDDAATANVDAHHDEMVADSGNENADPSLVEPQAHVTADHPTVPDANVSDEGNAVPAIDIVPSGEVKVVKEEPVEKTPLLEEKHVPGLVAKVDYGSVSKKEEEVPSQTRIEERKKCRPCNKFFAPQFGFCDLCGKKLSIEQVSVPAVVVAKFCEGCGSKRIPGHKFCDKCGRKQF